MNQLTFSQALELNKKMPIRFVFKEKTKNNNDVIYEVGQLIKTIDDSMGLILEAGYWFVHNEITIVASSLEYTRDENSYAPSFSTDAEELKYFEFIKHLKKGQKIQITLRALDGK